MSADPLHSLHRVAGASLRVGRALERLPLAGALPTALIGLVADPAALLDELLAPLVDREAAPPADEPPSAHDDSASPSPTPWTFSQPGRAIHAPPPALGSPAPRRSERRAAGPSTRAPAAPAIHTVGAAGLRPAPPSRLQSPQHDRPGSSQPPLADAPDQRQPPPFDAGSRWSLDVDRALDEPAPNTQDRPLDQPAPRSGLQSAPLSHARDAVWSSPANRNDQTANHAAPPQPPTPGSAEPVSSGMRLTRNSATLSALLRAQTSSADGGAAPASAGAAPINHDDLPDSRSNGRGDDGVHASAAQLANQLQPENVAPAAASARSSAAPQPLDIEQIMRDLADRLEFEYLRMYGTSGD